MFISILFAAYIVFLFLRLHEYVPAFYETPVLTVLLGSCLIFWLFKPEKNLNSLQLKLLLGFIFAAIFSHLSWFYLQGTIDTTNILSRRLAIFLIASSIFILPKQIELYMRLLCICGLVIAIHGIEQFHGSDGIGWTGVKLFRDERIRYIGIFKDPNDLGMLLLIILALLAYIVGSTKFFLTKFLWLTTAPVIFYAIVLTKSRGTFASLLMLTGVYTWKRFNPFYTGFVAALLIPLAVIKTRLSTIGTTEASTVGRVDAWYEGFQMLKSNPFFGVGYTLFTDHHDIVAHSSYVQVAAETGLIGYFFWFSFLMCSIYMTHNFAYQYEPTSKLSAKQSNELLKLKGLSKGILFGLLAYAFTTFFISRTNSPLFLVLCAMASGFYFYVIQKYPDYMDLTFKNTFKICAYSSAGMLVFIYLIIFVFFRA